MTTSDRDDVWPADAPDSEAPASPFRRLTPQGQPAWHSPPRPEPIDSITAPSPPPTPIESAPSPAALSRSRFSMAAIVGLAGGVFLLTLVAGGAYIAYRALLSHDDLVTAEYAPADSWAYVAVNVDPTSRAWLDAWELAKRAGLDDELSELPADGLEDSGEDPETWETLIEPAVGAEVGFAVWPNPAGTDEEPYVAAIVMVEDEEKASEAIDELLDDERPIETTYRDVTYQINDDNSAVGIVDDALILATSSFAFESLVDARRDGALDADTAFTAAAERAADDPLVFVYVDSASIAEAAESIQDELLDVPSGMMFGTPDMGDALDTYAEMGQVTVTIKADGDALRTEVLTEGRPENYPTTPASDRFARQMPDTTVFYTASADLYASVWQPIVEQMEEMFGASGDGMTGMPNPDDVEEMLGVDLEGGLLEQLVGPYALSVNVEEEDGDYSGQFHLFSELADPETAAATLDDLADTLEDGGLPVDRTADGFTIEVPEEELTIEATVTDDVLHLSGSYRSGVAIGTLASDEAFQAAMDGLPDNASVTGYVATGRILDLLPDDAWEEMDSDAQESLNAFGPLVWATAPDGDGTRTVFVVTVE